MVGKGVTPLDVRAVVMHFGADPEHAVTAFNDGFLSFQGSKFFTLLGPSGCGRTTSLRLTAAFERPTEGETLLFGEHLEGLPPNRRPINTVFLHDALFPHMTVVENVAFGLKRLKRLSRGIGELVRQSNASGVNAVFTAFLLRFR